MDKLTAAEAAWVAVALEKARAETKDTARIFNNRDNFTEEESGQANAVAVVANTAVTKIFEHLFTEE